MAESSALSVTAETRLRLGLRSDARLARAAAAGDQRAFAKIFERYHQELYRFCRALLNDPDDAQDALQATMASALRGLPGEERRIELRPWLYRVARNEAITIIRRRRKAVEIDDRQLPPVPAADAAFDSRERLRALVSDLRALPERQRSALVMRELSGLSYEQIASALEASAGAARQVVYEARLALQDLEEGRAMSCAEVRRAVSEGDGRVLRGRKLRAHLRGCEDCASFRAAIATRSADLQALAPPLPAVAASGILAALLGGGGGAGLFGGLMGGKMLGLVAATAAIGVGAGVSGVDVPVIGSAEEPAAQAPIPSGASEERSPGSAAEGARPSGERGRGRAGGGETGQRPRRHKARDEGRAHGRGGVNGGPQGAESSAAGGASGAVPAGTGRPETPPGSGVATERAGKRNATPSTGKPEHAASGPPERAKLGNSSIPRTKIK